MAMELWRRKKEKKAARKYFFENGSRFLEELIKDCNGISNPIRMFSSHQILKATDHFKAKYSHSRDWYCYDKGFIEGRPCLIKIFSDDCEKGERNVYNDIVLSARVSNHSSFLKLLGCSLEFPFPVVVFENSEYGVLNERGSVGSVDGPLLPWNVRLKIAKEVAIAVTYLHTAFPRIIIHRDVKPTNVFLDKNWNAKLTDFSLSVTLPENETWIEEYVVGTYGYAVSIYMTTGVVTEYSDVFSFGIFMLVLLMGRPAILRDSTTELNPFGINILNYVKDLRERGEAIEFGGDSNDLKLGQMNKFLELALRCCEERNEDRPKMILVAKEIKLIETLLDCLLKTEMLEFGYEYGLIPTKRR